MTPELAAWKVWVTILGLFLATYLIRFSFIGLLGGRPVPEGLKRALVYVPAAVLPALIAPMVLTEGGAPAFLPEKLVPALAAFALGVATRNVLAGILGGLGGYLAVQPFL